MKKRFTEEQIVKVLDESRSGLHPDELCRKHGISRTTFYDWRTKYGNMNVTDVQKLKILETENTKLKRLVADYALDIVALKDVLSKKW